MNNCFTIGYFKSNFGDDLMVSKLAEYNSDKKFILHGCEETHFTKFSSQENIYKSDNFLLNIYHANSIVFIGGSLFRDYSNNAWVYYCKVLFLLIISKLMLKKVYIFSSNFGPFNKKITRFIVKCIIRLCDKIVVRDRASIDFCSKNSSAYLTKDIVDESSTDHNKNASNVIRNLGVSVMSFNKLGQKYKHALVQEILRCCKLSEDIAVQLFPFCEDEGDVIASEEIYELLHSRGVNVEIVRYCQVEELQQRLSQMDYMICSRFHSMIMSIVNDINMSVFIYSDKTVEYLKTHYNLETTRNVDYKCFKITTTDLQRARNEENLYVF
ncbi:MAG: polysaccharide pyruvyl transferase family protein [Pseudoalteromonas nigrifaciens]